MRDSGVVSFLQFTFDLASGDLKRDGGRRIRMPEQTIRLLAILVERAGMVVTRDEIQQLLWPQGEFLDHEHAINRIITHLRSVLRDDPSKPRFIETVRKRGYRFLPPVAVIAWESTPEIELVPPSRQEAPLADRPQVDEAKPFASGSVPPTALVLGQESRQLAAICLRRHNLPAPLHQ